MTNIKISDREQNFDYNQAVMFMQNSYKVFRTGLIRNGKVLLFFINDDGEFKKTNLKKNWPWKVSLADFKANDYQVYEQISKDGVNKIST